MDETPIVTEAGFVAIIILFILLSTSIFVIINTNLFGNKDKDDNEN